MTGGAGEHSSTQSWAPDPDFESVDIEGGIHIQDPPHTNDKGKQYLWFPSPIGKQKAVQEALDQGEGAILKPIRTPLTVGPPST